MNEIVIVDYGMGNLRSVQKKFERIGIKALVSGDLKSIEMAQKIVLPGVGHFTNAVKKLKTTGIWEVLNYKVLDRKTSFIGICLGMQLMGKSSEEGNTEGLGWFDSQVVRFKVSDKIKYKVPHMGWNNITVEKENMFFTGINPDSQFYFVHSYHFVCNSSEDVLTTTHYDYPFTSSVLKENILGVQFHPEKSHDQGEMLLRNFVRW